MTKSKFYIFLYAVTTRVFFNLVGRLMLAEIIALVSFPYTKFRKLLSENRELKVILSGLLFLLVAQIVSDIYNNSSPSDYLRGWAVIVFSIISLIYLFNHLYKNVNNIIYYLMGIMLINLFFGEGKLDTSIIVENTNYFKVRFVEFLNPAIILIAYFLFNKKKKLWSSIVFILYGVFCIIMDARSNSLVFILSGLLIFLKLSNKHLSRKKIFAYSLVLTALLFTGYIFYVNQVLYKGFGGSNAKTQLNKTSNPYNPFELLLYGRTDLFVAIKAIQDSPVFGHGSWAHDENRKYHNYMSKITGSKNITIKEFIPSHSVLFGAWLYTGITGFIIILIIIFMILKLFYNIFNNYNTLLLPIVTVLSLQIIWHLIFSPYSHLRTSLPISISFLIALKYSLIQENYDNHVPENIGDHSII